MALLFAFSFLSVAAALGRSSRASLAESMAMVKDGCNSNCVSHSCPAGFSTVVPDTRACQIPDTNNDSCETGSNRCEDSSCCEASGGGGGSGDPHMVRLDGTHFDLFEDGTHDLLTSGDLKITIDVAKMFNSGPNTHFTTKMNVAGGKVQEPVRIHATPFGVEIGEKFTTFEELLTTKTDEAITALECGKHTKDKRCISQGKVISINGGSVTANAAFKDFPAKAGFLDVGITANTVLEGVTGLLAPLHATSVREGASAAAIDKEVTDVVA